MRRRDGRWRSVRLARVPVGFRRETPTATAQYHVTAPADAATHATVLPAETPQRQPLRLAGRRATGNAVRAAAHVCKRHIQHQRHRAHARETCALPLCGSRARRIASRSECRSGVVGRLRFRSARRSHVRRSAGSAARRHRHELRRSIGHGHVATAPPCRLDVVSCISSLLGDVSGRLGNGDVRGDATGAPNGWCASSFRPRPRLAAAPSRPPSRPSRIHTSRTIGCTRRQRRESR